MSNFENNLRKAMLGGMKKKVGDKEKVKEKVVKKTAGSNELISDPKTDKSNDKECERDIKVKKTTKVEALEKEKKKSDGNKAGCSKLLDLEKSTTDSDSSVEIDKDTKGTQATKSKVVSIEKTKKPIKRQFVESSSDSSDSDDSESHKYSKHFREAVKQVFDNPEVLNFSGQSGMTEKEIEMEERPPIEGVPVTTPMENLASFIMALPITKEKRSTGARLLQELAECIQREEDDVMDMRKHYVHENRELRAKVDRLEAEIGKIKEKEQENSLEDKINKLSEKLESFMSGSSNRALETPVSKPLLYSDIIKANKKTRRIAKKAEIKLAKPVAAIYPVDGSKIKSSEETKKALAKCINPAEHGIKIRNLRKIRNSGLLIETETKEDLEQVLSNDKLKKKLKIGSIPKRKPKLIIFGVPSDTAEEELYKGIIKQNLEQVTEEKSGEEFKLLFKTGRKENDTTNWVAEVSPQTRTILLARSRVFVGFNAYGVRDYIAASRCYKCHAFGHVSKYCRSKIDTCGHCGKDGHIFKDCPNKKEKPTCINCKRAGKPSNHGIREQSCPAYKYAIEKYLSQIDFG